MIFIKLHERDSNTEVFVNINNISIIGNGIIFIGSCTESFSVKETPEEILRLIEEAKQPSHTVAGGYSPSYLPNNSTMISPADLEASRVQQLVDGAHAVEQLMREKDPTYGR